MAVTITDVQRLNTMSLLLRDTQGRLELAGFLEELYSLFPSFLNISRICILLYDEEAGGLVSDTMVGVNRGEKIKTGVQNVGESISGKCFLLKRPLLVNDCSNTDLIPAEYVEQLGLKSTLAVPLTGQHEVLGVMRLDDTRAANHFSDQDVDFFSTLGRLVGRAIESTKLFEKVRRAENELRRLNETLEKQVQERTRELQQATVALRAKVKEAEELAREQTILTNYASRLVQAESVEDLAKAAYDVTIELFDWDALLFSERIENSDHFQRVLAADTINGKRGILDNKQYPPRPYQTREELHRGQPLLLNNLQNHASLIRFGDMTRVSASLLYAPILYSGKLYGIISVQSYTPGRYTQKDLDLLMTMAIMAAPALGRVQAERALNRDIELRKQMEQALRASEERYALAALGANDGLWDWDLANGHIFYSPRWCEMIGCREGELRPEIIEWFSRVHPSEQNFVREEVAAFLAGTERHFRIEFRMRHKDGNYRWFQARGAAVRDEKQAAVRVAGSLTDITERRAAEEQLARAALHDSLTEMPNRALLMERLEHCLARKHRQPGYMFALLFLDLDNFKYINDTYGHIVGDKFLQQVAHRLKQITRGGDTVSRFGGDEFALLLDDLKDASEVEIIAQRILDEIAEPFVIDGTVMVTSTSIGIALSMSGYREPVDILGDADKALYRAKAAGRGRYVIDG